MKRLPREVMEPPSGDMQNSPGLILVMPEPAVLGWMISRGPFQLLLFYDSAPGGVPEQISLGDIDVLITENLVIRLSAVPVKQVFGRHFRRGSDVCVCFVY